jgi:hypothetical protein
VEIWSYILAGGLSLKNNPFKSMIFNQPQLGSKALDKIAIVHHSQDRTFKPGQGLFEARARGNIEMIDGLIQEQKGAALDNEHSQG